MANCVRKPRGPIRSQKAESKAARKMPLPIVESQFSS